MEWDASMSPHSSSASSDVSEEIEETEVGSEWTSTNGKVAWSATPHETPRYFPVNCMPPGPTSYALARITGEVRSVWDLFITDDVIQIVLDMTNLRGRRGTPAWQKMDRTELEAFLGLLLLAGVYRSHGESTRSLWSKQSGRAVFPATMSRNRYETIAANLRFSDRRARPQGPGHPRPWALGPLCPQRRLALLFVPARDVCVDEQLIPFRGRCSFRQYIPRKPAKYGLKEWAACDARTSYAFRMQVYTGKQEGTREANQGRRVVLDLTAGLAGHTVTCGKLFTSYGLGEELLKQKTGMVGTIRHSKRDLPPVLLKTQHRDVKSSVFCFSETHAAVSYIVGRRRNVLLLSTVHREPALSEEAHQEPQILLDYNRCKGAVDTLDRRVGAYSCRRRTCRWPLTLFYNILDISAFNAFVLWMEVDSSWNESKPYKRRLFLEQLGLALVMPNQRRRQHLPGVPMKAAAAVAVAPARQREHGAGEEAAPKRRRCQQCPGPARKRAQTKLTYCKCGKSICKFHASLSCSLCASS